MTDHLPAPDITVLIGLLGIFTGIYLVKKELNTTVKCPRARQVSRLPFKSLCRA